MKITFPAHQVKGFSSKLAVLFAASFLSMGVHASNNKFEQIFNTKGEPKSLYYQATFTNQKGEHQLEAWRQGQRFLKKRTDDEIETYVSHAEGDIEFKMSILDLKKKIHTRIDRTNLARIGNFTDWFDLTHVIKTPRGEYQLNAAKAPINEPKPLETCTWYDLTAEGKTSHICWSSKQHVPMLIVNLQNKVIWKITKINQTPILNSVFTIHDEGFIKNDANQDIEND